MFSIPTILTKMADIQTIDLTEDDVIPPPSIKQKPKINHKTECTDDIINEYFTLLKIRNDNEPAAKTILAYDSLHYTLMDKHGIKKMVQWHDGEIPLEKDLVLFPLHSLPKSLDESGHWSLIAAFPKDKLVRSYDSLGLEHPARLRQTLKYLEESAARYQVVFEKKKWALKGNSWRLPMQRNSIDCGFYVCFYAECLARGEDPSNVPRPRSRDVRKAVASALRNNRIEEIVHTVEYNL